MKFARIGELGAEQPVVVDGDIHYSLSPITGDLDGEFWAGGGPERAATAIRNNELREIDITGQRIGAPISRPSAVICIGMNYAAHAAESGSQPPTAPIMFLKTPNTVIGPNDAVAIPRGSTKTDWEVELGVVIATHAEYLDSPADSRRHIAGCTVVNDLSEREFQIEISGGQWSKGKSSPGFCPTGPWLVTADDIDYTNLRLRSWVNNEPRQDSTTADLISGVDYLGWYLSQYLALEPGDLICTGTPEGVALSGRFPYLSAGDTVTLEIDGLGRQTRDFTDTTDLGRISHER